MQANSQSRFKDDEIGVSVFENVYIHMNTYSRRWNVRFLLQNIAVRWNCCVLV